MYTIRAPLSVPVSHHVTLVLTLQNGIAKKEVTGHTGLFFKGQCLDAAEVCPVPLQDTRVLT